MLSSYKSSRSLSHLLMSSCIYVVMYWTNCSQLQFTCEHTKDDCGCFQFTLFWKFTAAKKRTQKVNITDRGSRCWPSGRTPRRQQVETDSTCTSALTTTTDVHSLFRSATQLKSAQTVHGHFLSVLFAVILRFWPVTRVTVGRSTRHASVKN